MVLKHKDASFLFKYSHSTELVHIDEWSETTLQSDHQKKINLIIYNFRKD
jgi:hypothetical protein